MKKILLSSTVVLALSAFGASLAYAEGGHERHGPRGPNFEQIDANGDGILTMEEFQNQANMRFAEADTNGDGQLDVDELTAAAERARGEMIARMIEKKDTNGDGMLSMEEMAPRDAGHFFEMADSDGNGEISKAEWEAAKENMRGHGPHPRGGFGEAPSNN